MEVRLSVEPGAEDLPLPAYETEYAAGMDLRAAVAEALSLAPGQRAPAPRPRSAPAAAVPFATASAW
jgi:dUTP pyrophosphatase